MKFSSILGSLLAFGSALLIQANDEDAGSIPEVAAAVGFSTLVTAVTAANLGDVLSGDGPFSKLFFGRMEVL